MSEDGVRKVNENIVKEGRSLILNTFINEPINIPAGTMYIDPSSGNTQFLLLDTSTKEKAWTKFKFNNFFDEGSFSERLIKDNSLNGEKITSLSLAGSKLADKTITNEKIADNTISTNNIKEINGSKIADNSISTNKIIDNAITNTLLFDKTITNDKIKNSTIINDLIADNTINNTKIANGTIEANKIASKTIINSLLADNCIENRNIKQGAIETNHLSNGCIDENKILNKSISTNKIKNFSITDILINDVDGSKIAENSIVSSKLKDNSITSDKILNNTITKSKLNKSLQDTLDNVLKIENSIIYDDIHYLNTALIEGNMVLKKKNDTCSLTVDGNIDATGNITGARVYNPYFADIAEAYIPDEYLFPGDPVCLCKDGGLKVEKLNDSNGDRFIGFVSNEYASLFGGTIEEIKSRKKVAITLVGRIKIKLGLGFEAKVGDYLTLIHSMGIIGVSKERTVNSIGRVLENKTKNETTALCQLWP